MKTVEETAKAPATLTNFSRKLQCALEDNFLCTYPNSKDHITKPLGACTRAPAQYGAKDT